MSEIVLIHILFVVLLASPNTPLGNKQSRRTFPGHRLILEVVRLLPQQAIKRPSANLQPWCRARTDAPSLFMAGVIRTAIGACRSLGWRCKLVAGLFIPPCPSRQSERKARVTMQAPTIHLTTPLPSKPKPRRSKHRSGSRQRAARKFKLKTFGASGYHPCYWCGEVMPLQLATVDHIRPVSDGGDDSDENMAICCIACNRARGAFTAILSGGNRFLSLSVVESGLAWAERFGWRDPWLDDHLVVRLGRLHRAILKSREVV